MPKFRLRVALALILLVVGSVPLAAQPLPKVRLRPVFPALTLDRPIWMGQPPDGSDRLFVVEETGRIVTFPKAGDGSQVKEFFNITSRRPYVDMGANTAVGLLSLAFHPGFKTNGLFYVCYSQENVNRNGPFPRRSVISEFRVSAADPDQADLNSERILLEVPEPFNSNQGGQVSFGPDGFLYLSLGDGGSNNDPFNNGQNTASLLGKMLRIDVNTRSTTGTGKDIKKLPYGIPSDNPFAAEPEKWPGVGVRKEIYAWGLRNVWRFSWDAKTGNLWAGDVGEKKWEEVDLIVKGGNYGWCVREGAHEFKPGPMGAQFVEPVIEYGHNTNLQSESKFSRHSIGLCIIGGYVYRGKKYPSLDGIYIYADYVLGTIWGFRYADGRVSEYGTLLDQPKNIQSFAEDGAGELYILSFGERHDGHVYALEANEP